MTVAFDSRPPPKGRQGARPTSLRIPRRLRHLQVIQAAPNPERPKTRADCLDGPRPCPWVSCRHHLYLDVKATTGTVTLNRPLTEPDELTPSCSLDVADRGGATLDAIARMLGLTRERVRQIEAEACDRIAPLLRWWHG